ncbi:hypothetical protein B0I35DRAFT_63193 [Stachybotrys elegans]|uniref:Uncharacterized protein n=1 Tax=Stachybotrys elegans TaxID=80388 RepID=A0A8K0SKW8_9HYPO|nr:hypothetical protein B0I35DRAFT_63193 [Stachybotrys elegans]
MSARIRDDTKEESTNSTHVPQLAVPPRSASSSISQGKDVLLSPTSAASNTMAPNIPLGEFQQSYIIQLLDRIHILEGENCALKQQDEEADEQCTSYRVFHMLENQNENAYTTSESDSEGESPDTSSYTAFLREPQWEWCDGTANLRGLGMIASPQDHIKADRKIAFAVYKYYNVSFQRTAIENAAKAKQVFPDPAPFRQSVQLISKEMAEAARNVARLAPNSLRGIVDLSVRNPTFEPFIWWYHQRHTDILHRLPDRQEALMRLLTSWVESNHSSIYAAIDAEFEQGLVSPLSIGYLVRPDEALVSIDPQGLTRGYIAMATANLQLNGQKEPDLPLSRGVEGAPRDDSQSHRIQTWTVKASSYKLDASLQVDVAYLSLTIRLGSAKNGPVPIRSLGVFPLSHADTW